VDEFLTVLGQLSVIVGLGAVGAALSWRNFQLRWFVGALSLYLVYDFLLTRFFFALPNFPPELTWNWGGKFMSLSGMLLIASLPILGYRKCGLTFSQNEGFRSALLALLILSAICFYFAISGADGPDTWETIAFQWTMPGLDEEVFYRGVLLLMMNEAFGGRVSVLGAQIGYGGLLTSVLFGLAHGLSYGEGAYAFDTTLFLITAGPSLLLLWMRERTGSVLMPIIAHNVANGAFTLF